MKIATAALMLALSATPWMASAQTYQIIEQPRQQCWNEQVPVQASAGIGGAIVGGLAGGILGNQIGQGNGRTVATAVGAATGAVVGDRMSATTAQMQTVRRCRTVMEQVRVPVQAPVQVQVPAQLVMLPPAVGPAPVYLLPPATVVEQRVIYPGEPYRPHPGRGHGHWKHHHFDD
ncbi:Glycine zipper 2TM domain-containing protein [Noviherbaspirillum humi]|uniref:Glycine zipper 2TM domain-containing protein n=1 Tax=Noviherbaspirillum humi TaxID=1688639 RepID=A0A239IPP7_9BURK|nr:glycine zipper 2TM domain-containing protein [Noviherbaspirillum humi]SNS95529.1 Glycine zipper 2TM domain-containing protein [Noviherbaspirillum humi]